ncbi:IS3 family transposase [Salmonella enterica]|uniref:Integrase catalytic domain-containing protein n=1 Tax=Salmonella newport TaxID=108619 RepID=A0A5U9VT25_SALNE|nr:hypothetical protein [Salmonella enterica subsp. enterica serovar Newport]ECB3302066.1 hypothetical protein [Salmonella enterica subsp. enterica serovar Newport]EHI3122924.1 IS3 family transposase [Salmonella enterica]
MIISVFQAAPCMDNAAMKNVFGTLKSECFYLNQFSRFPELRITIKDYIQYHNNERISM